MTPNELNFEVNRGTRFIVYQFCVSFVVITLRRPTAVQMIKPGESTVTRGLPWTLLSALFGWWGIPWGFIYTPQVIYKNLHGGLDVTQATLAQHSSTHVAPPAIVGK